ncbi:DedA family protein [Pengzhenrongella sicca]|uniref:DedA family protein n=1 Tax=Pengzhenrongella sicca TaxID=2819238 RepID=A0A8A4ZHY3_9MICO|nr:DedA family protein [Pengzhenrongella sicca]QTE30875.1 DedA family protein [Pengzhenrongella sicca]
MIAYVALYLLVALDGIFPPVPSESAVITLAALSSAGGGTNLVLVLLVAAAGAFTGDQVAYVVGRRINPRRLPFLRTTRGRRTVAWAGAALTRRGPAVILAARYLPVARVAVNVTAGAVGYPRAKFSVLTAIGAVGWSAYSAVLGVTAGAWFPGRPLLAVSAGIVSGVVIGLAVDQVLRWASARAHPSGSGDAPARATQPVYVSGEELAHPCPSGEKDAEKGRRTFG